MKKILLQLDSDRSASVFDAVTAYDAGADILLQHGGIAPEEVRALVYGAMFTRGPADLKNSAVFVGGTDVAKGEVMLKEVCDSFFGPLRTSVMLDANGCNTTATAAVVKLISIVPVSGAKVVVLAGTGPVGQRAAALFAKEGAEVVLTSRTLARAEAACKAIGERFGATVTPAAAADEDSTRSVLEGAVAVLCTGVTGVTLIPEAMWREHATLRVLGDVNAVPPLGLEATKATWDGKEIDGKTVFGALAIGDLKMKVHKRSIARLFEQNDLVLDAEEIFALAKELAG
jgi:methylenetetrahydrofolate/methylenetetrahydromethanopterin dehydrogenase (NADP+)